MVPRTHDMQEMPWERTHQEMTNLLTMVDSVNTSSMPAAPVYAAYVNGAYANWESVAVKFPWCRVFGIDVNGTEAAGASILDYEAGDTYNIPKAIGWVGVRNVTQPKTATVYCNRSNLGALDNALKGVWAMFWLATLDGTGEELVGTYTKCGHLIVGVQLKTVGSGNQAYDVSRIVSGWAYPE